MAPPVYLLHCNIKVRSFAQQNKFNLKLCFAGNSRGKLLRKRIKTILHTSWRREKKKNKEKSVITVCDATQCKPLSLLLTNLIKITNFSLSFIYHNENINLKPLNCSIMYAIFMIMKPYFQLSKEYMERTVAYKVKDEYVDVV